MKPKVLHIVRHGKALQDAYEILDHDRPLTVRGILNSITVANNLITLYSAPDLIISSYATRALHTAHIFARVMGYPHENVQVKECLYFKGDNEVYTVLKSLPDSINEVMIVGHNPDLTYVVRRFRMQIDNLSTSGAASLTFETSNWSDIYNSKAKHTYITK